MGKIFSALDRGAGGLPGALDVDGAVETPLRRGPVSLFFARMFFSPPKILALAVLLGGIVLVGDRAFATPAPGGGNGSGLDGDLAYSDLDAPEHRYWERPLRDPFTGFLGKLEAGKVVLDHGSELDYLRSLLRELGISPHSQLLVFSTTSLQLSLISPRNPRAVYFNESVYIGYIPGGRIEVVSLDPELGAVFYIFDIPEGGKPPQAERSDRCMNCHAKPSVGHVPGIVVKSVLPAPRGGSIDSFRRRETGHRIPLSERFGGWHVTGGAGLGEHWGNRIGHLYQGEVTTEENLAGQRFPWERYPVESSDALAHLLLEHQAGFVNRVVEASYRARTAWRKGGGKLRERDREAFRERAGDLVRYALFADEAELPVGMEKGDRALREDFLAGARADGRGRSLRDLSMEGRMFRHRCSYMIHTPLFRGLPGWFRGEVYRQMGEALRGHSSEGRHLGGEERETIRRILRDTVEDPLFAERFGE